MRVGDEDDDRDVAPGFGLIARVSGEDGAHERPEARFLLRAGGVRLRREFVCADLHFHAIILDEVQVPGGMLGVAAARGDDDVIRAVLAVIEGGAPQQAGLTATGRQQQGGRTAILMAFLSVAFDVALDVFVDPAGRAVVDVVLFGNDLLHSERAIH